MLTSKQRAALRREANGLQAVFQIGKEGVEPNLVTATADCLKKRELIKLRLLETCPHTPREAADIVAERTGADVVQVIGNVVVLFKRNTNINAFGEVLKK